MTALFYYALAIVPLIAVSAIAEVIAVKLGYIHPWEYK